MKKTILFIVVAVLLIATVTSCKASNYATVDSTVYDSLVIVVGHHKNAKVPDYSLIEEDILSACYNATKITVIVDDGEPYVFLRFIPPAIGSDLSQANKSKKAFKYAKTFFAEVNNITASSDEVDTYAALQLASRCVDGRTKLIVMDTMLPTAGIINFRATPLHTIDIDRTITNIDDSISVDYTNTYVELIGIGEVAGLQPKPGAANYKKLCKFWEEFFLASNIQSLTINTTPFKDSEECVSDYQVSIVPFIKDVNSLQTMGDQVSEKNSEDDKDGSYSIEEGVVIELGVEEKVEFLPDTSILVSPEASKETLMEVLESNRHTEIAIIGMTATAGTFEDALHLSKERAAQIKDLLIKLGFKADMIFTNGTGYDSKNPFHRVDILENGILVEDEARKNRVVLIMTKTTAEDFDLL